MTRIQIDLPVDLDTLYDAMPEGAGAPRIAVRLGVECRLVRALIAALRADLSADTFGIGWWAPHPGTMRRILISDHLVQCVASIEANLVEAQLHLHHARHFWSETSRAIAGVIEVTRSGQIGMKLPARERPTDDLPNVMGEMHVAGVLRAVGSALDCLGAAVVGVVGLPTDIKSTGLGRALQFLHDERLKGRLNQVQLDCLAVIASAREAAGPAGWFFWTTELRNVFVHRARRISKNLLSQVATLVGPDGWPLPRAEAIEMLPLEPGLSEMEVLRTGDPLSVLTERADATLSGVVGSARTCCNDVAQILSTLWNRRRSEPRLIVQPAEQWPTIAEGRDRFAGYKPGSVTATPDTLVTAPDMIDRIRFASLDGDSKKRWDSFD